MTQSPTHSNIAAGPFRRIFALIYDLLLLLGISFAYGVLVMMLRKFAGADTMQAPKGLIGLVILGGLLLCYGSFFSWCWLRRGQTLGMKSWRIQLVRTDGQPINLQTCFKRCIAAPLFILLGGIGFWWCWFDREGNSLQDKLTGTRTLLLPKNK